MKKKRVNPQFDATIRLGVVATQCGQDLTGLRNTTHTHTALLYWRMSADMSAVFRQIVYIIRDLLFFAHTVLGTSLHHEDA